MKWLVVVGIVLMLVGGGLMLKGSFKTKDEHEANIFGAKISVTETDRKQIPVAVSGTLLAVGAILTVVGALKGRPGR